MTSSVRNTFEFKTAIYILSRIVFRIDEKNVKRLEYKIFSEERDDPYYETIYHNTILQTPPQYGLIEHISTLNGNPILSYTGSWDPFTGTISQSNCSQYIQNLGYNIPNARSDNPVSSTIFGTIDIYCNSLSSLSNVDVNKIKYYTAQLLKYTGDTSHIISRRLLSYVINENPQNKEYISKICPKQGDTNVLSIFTNDRPLIYRSILKTLHEGEAVVFPALACYQDEKFFNWYDNFQVSGNNINTINTATYVRPKKCFCRVVKKDITPGLMVDNINNKLQEIYDKISTNPEYHTFHPSYIDLISEIREYFYQVWQEFELRKNTQPTESLLKDAYENSMARISDVFKNERYFSDLVAYKNTISREATFMENLQELLLLIFQKRMRNGTELNNRLFLLDGSRIKNGKIPEEFYVYLDKIEYFSLMYDKYTYLLKKRLKMIQYPYQM